MFISILTFLVTQSDMKLMPEEISIFSAKASKMGYEREKKMLIIDFSILCWIFFLSWSEEQVLNGLRARAPFCFLV